MSEITVATYNIHSSVGRDRVHDPGRISAVMAEIKADLFGLQEVGTGRGGRGRGIDQYSHFAEETGFHMVAGPNKRWHTHPYGNALLSRWPVLDARLIDLTIGRVEPRGAIDADLDVPGGLRVIVTHFGLRPDERWRQVTRLEQAIRGHDGRPLLFMGDFNIFGVERHVLKRLGARFAAGGILKTFPSNMPFLALDRLWSCPAALIDSLHVHRTALSAIASDHLPLVGRISLSAR